MPYFIAAFAFGVPLMVGEMSFGRDLKANVVTELSQPRREYELVRLVVSGTVLVILSYFLVITGWLVSFPVYTAGGVETTVSDLTWSYLPVGRFVVCTVLVGAIVSLGVK